MFEAFFYREKNLSVVKDSLWITMNYIINIVFSLLSNDFNLLREPCGISVKKQALETKGTGFSSNDCSIYQHM